MARVSYTPELAKEYGRLFDKATVNPSAISVVHKAAALVYAGRSRYMLVAAKFKCPWPLIGVIHNLEGSCDFDTHLHDGDPLTARTVNEPAGRPLKGEPPFTWEESAEDAIEMKGWGRIEHWTLERAMYELERYNGFGYRTQHPDVLSPYLFSKTNLYTRGKYVKDHKFSASAVSGQVGALAVLLALAEIDPDLSLDKMLPREHFEDEPEDDSTILFVQQRLKDLGYFEVGSVDGRIGGKTKAAILSFRHDNRLGDGSQIDDELLTGLARAPKRTIAPERAQATAAELRSDKPALASSLSSKIISGVTGGATAAYAAVQGVVAAIPGAKATLDPIKDLIGSVPSGVWVALVGAAAFAVYLNSRKAETEVVSAFREGSLQ